MNPSDIPPQAYWYRYGGPFTAEMDTTHLESLMMMKRRGGWTSADIPDDALQTARLTVNHQHNTRITMDDLINRKHFMQLRYMTFKELAHEKRAIWDPATNLVAAEEKDWKKSFKKNAFAKAYRFQGDPEFHKLCYLFGPHQVKEESSTTQTPRLSATQVLEGNTNQTGEVSDDEEINSPNGARRRLFDEGFSAGDRQSTNNMAEEGNLPFPPRNAIPRRYKGNSSSCASSSPVHFNWGPFQ